MINIYIKELKSESELNLNINTKKKKDSKILRLIRKIKFLIIKYFNLIIAKDIEENKKIYYVPNIEKNSVYKKINKKLSKEETKTQKIQIILSEKIKNYKKYFDKYKIIDGRKIFIYYIEQVLEKILNDEKLAMQDIYITTNNYIEQNINIIKRLAVKVKTINIITKEVEKYKILEQILEEKGIAITVSNNRKKSLKKSKIIINLDFTKEILSEYIINRYAIIVNTINEKIANLKAFEGIVIQNIDIELEKDIKEFIKNNKLDNFNKIEIYESSLDKTNIKQKNKVCKLYGNNGEINEKELIKLQEKW